MKKQQGLNNKLSLKKFQIAKINNPQNIFGGNVSLNFNNTGGGDGDGDDTVDTKGNNIIK